MSANSSYTTNKHYGCNNPPCSSDYYLDVIYAPSGSPSPSSQPPIPRTFYLTNAPSNLGGRDDHDDTEGMAFALGVTIIIPIILLLVVGIMAVTYFWFDANRTEARPAATTIEQDQQASSEKRAAKLLRAKVLRVVLPEQTVESLQYDPEVNETAEGTICPICIETLQQGHSFVAGSRCKHAFHRDCILGWCQIRADCPTCRQEMWDPTEYGLVEKEIAAQESETASEAGSESETASESASV